MLSRHKKRDFLFQVVQASEKTLDVRIQGNLDEKNSSQLQQEIEDLEYLKYSQVTIDMSEVAFLSSAAITTMIRLYKKLSAKGADLIIENPQPTVAKILHMTRLDTQLKIISLDTQDAKPIK
ncbi:MAG: STAS domain-containing protein [Candidatus Riflebacteria bacterium]|nr:STAS domain-containing protein [Candidatus Riflebacteria bacterium]